MTLQLNNFPYYSVRTIPCSKKGDDKGFIYSMLTKDQRLKEIVLYDKGGAYIMLTTNTDLIQNVYSKEFVKILIGQGEYYCSEVQFAEAQQEALNRIL